MTPKRLPAPKRDPHPLRLQAAVLRTLATQPDAMQDIGRQSAFGIGDRWFHNDCQGPEDRCVPHPVTGQTTIAPSPLSPMELIDDACALEVIADKLEGRPTLH